MEPKKSKMRNQDAEAMNNNDVPVSNAFDRLRSLGEATNLYDNLNINKPGSVPHSDAGICPSNGITYGAS